ncbi:unnamed protein product [Polarella glacialis]|uniref:Piwi domain-containing protein n=1 Tax=Polarella glacialis TaxID=89957 RepID=A0A813HA18_POLGL|nr:unnamed protein product [Polarella glacialis]
MQDARRAAERSQDRRIVSIEEPRQVLVSARDAETWVRRLQEEQRRAGGDMKFAVVVVPGWLKSDAPKVYYDLKQALGPFAGRAGVASQMVLTSTLSQDAARMQIARNICQQILVKCGAWLWTFSPLPYMRRKVMVVGVDARSASVDNGQSVQVLCASTNCFFTSYFTTWRAKESVRRGLDFTSPPLELLLEALGHFMRMHGRPPDSLVLYRSGVSDSQEAALFESEVQELIDGALQRALLATEACATSGVDLSDWARTFEIAYILVRRNTRARFRTEDFQNVPSGTVVDEGVVAPRMPGSGHHDFFLVSQSCKQGTARPALYSVLYSSLSMSKEELVDLSYMLCGMYMTFTGRVSVPAPLRYATKLLSQICGMKDVPSRPAASASSLQHKLFFV